MIKILFVASESSPFYKVGGLGDVIGTLPKYLINEGIDVRVILPKYKNFNNNFFVKLEKDNVFQVKFNNNYEDITMYKGKYDNIIYYFMDNEEYFAKSNIYGYSDEVEKFALFDKAIFKWLLKSHWKPDIIHCHDWQSALIPYLFKREHINNFKFLLTIHNMRYQGAIENNKLCELIEEVSCKEHYYNFNSFLQCGIIYSDYISTVSEGYRKEICTHFYGEGLEEILKDKGERLWGILNGIDYESYNPTLDEYIPFKFNEDIIEAKNRNKEYLQDAFSLTVDKNIPMFVMVSRLTQQKGCDLVINALDKMLKDDIQFIVLGVGEKSYERAFFNLQEKYSKKMAFVNCFSEELAHKIYAAGDILLMPSLFEPCGLSQLIAMRYGTVPIVRKTGGLKDTVNNFHCESFLGNGIIFENYNEVELINSINRALTLFNNKDIWRRLVYNCIKSNNSWENTSNRYIQLYKDILNN